MADLTQAREIINEVDKEIAILFERRMDAARMVAEYKKERGLQVTDAQREEELIFRNSHLIDNEEYRQYYVSFLRETIEISKKFQHRLLDGMKVSFSGVEGAFANIAANRIFPDATTVPHADFKSAYEAVVNGECDCAVLPVENNYNGDVGQVMDLAFFGPLYINGIYDIEIVQNLLVNKGTTMDQIKQVISHPQALGQCAEYIRKHGFEPVEAVNTAVAAKMVAESGRNDLAAIGSDEAAERYGLRKIRSRINESNINTTRFAVFTKTPKSTDDKDKQFVMLFTVNNEAGSLSKAMQVIGKYGFNLRALKSRPTKDLIWSYYFYAEGEGNIHSPEGEQMLREMQTCCNNLKVVGSFEKETML